MHFFRLLKPLWGQKLIPGKGEERIENPDFIEEIKGKNTLEGIFELDFISQKNDEGYNVYWFPNHPSKDIYVDGKKYLSGRDIDVFEWVFIDMDLKDEVYKTKEEFYEVLAQFPIKPTMTVFSGNGVHVYWHVEDLDREKYLIAQKRLIQHFKTDDSVWTVLQLLRWPGSKNTKKHDKFIQTKTVEDLTSGEVYKWDDLTKILPPITPENEQKIRNHMDKLDGKVSVQLGADVNADELPDKFLLLMEKEETVRNLFVDPIGAKGDRSAADAALVNHLFAHHFSRREALNVMMNTAKALSKGLSRSTYAASTVSFVYEDRVENRFKNVAEKMQEGRKEARGQRIYGPDFFDNTYKGWRKGQVMGVIAGPGVGKTSVALKIFKELIQNNPENDDVFVFFSLEMPEYEIEERWAALVGKDSPLNKRLYVIGNEDALGDPRSITVQDVFFFCQDIRKETGKEICAVVIDHIGILNPLIDISRQPSFGGESDINGGKGKKRILSMQNLCNAMKPLAKMLNTFVIPLTQTTKGKGGGDTPIGIDGAYGASQYEWIMDYIITLWQPLMRIVDDTDLRVLAWQYVKIRSKHREDGVKPYVQYTLNYDMNTGDLRPLNRKEKEEFDELVTIANEVRKQAERKEGASYQNSLTKEDLKKLKAL